MININYHSYHIVSNDAASRHIPKRNTNIWPHKYFYINSHSGIIRTDKTYTQLKCPLTEDEQINKICYTPQTGILSNKKNANIMWYNIGQPRKHYANKSIRKDCLWYDSIELKFQNKLIYRHRTLIISYEELRSNCWQQQSYGWSILKLVCEASPVLWRIPGATSCIL